MIDWNTLKSTEKEYIIKKYNLKTNNDLEKFLNRTVKHIVKRS